ncbi:MAG: hypothetical protein NUV56_04040, partial [Candidatus Uhrbacteria bacterium]|nr:hypothetical protein [Candidatus Uhrbacteria bacterium]
CAPMTVTPPPLKKCPVCAMPIDGKPVVLRRGDDVWEFCTEACMELFKIEPLKYESAEDEEDD